MERRIYRVAARHYRDTFRLCISGSLAARRRLRRDVSTHGVNAACEAWRAVLPSAVDDGEPSPTWTALDAAFLYFTQWERRPRRSLVRIAAAIRAELRARTYMERQGEARREHVEAVAQAKWITDARAESRRYAGMVLDEAAHVYREPRRACRNMLRCVRRGNDAWRALLERPESFGRLRIGFRWVVWPTTEEAEQHAPGLARVFLMACTPYSHRGKVGELGKLAKTAARAWAIVEEVEAEPLPRGGNLKDAARLLAVLYHRRDVDEAPKGNGPPPIRDQLAALLPKEAERLIREVMHQARSARVEEFRERERSLNLALGFGVARGPERHGPGFGR
ncbi:MAG TPA: hypothetical protein VFE05_10405 [Longimicrobiaceae bacterium]|jgi:hypothetical protein|nr:hypothetical protein [Longimicrobiaceae bacterium]